MIAIATSAGVARWLLGRTIVAVDLRPFDSGRGYVTYDPHITLDDGSEISLVVDETEDEYGVRILRHPPKK